MSEILLRTTIAERLEVVNSAIATAAVRVGRQPDEVTLIAVSKTVGRSEVDEAIKLGVSNFGENRVGDISAKYAEPLPSEVQLHMIGQLQSNKASDAVRMFDLIQSVDRLSLIAALENKAASRDVNIEILLQVNLAGETQKAGCAPEQTQILVDRIKDSPHLSLRGLMTMAPLVNDPESTRTLFRNLAKMRHELTVANQTLTLPILSMGMSNDFIVAIEEGATHIRIGRAIFGG